MQQAVRAQLDPTRAEAAVGELVALGAVDFELVDDGTLHVLFPGPVPRAAVEAALGVPVVVAPARFGDHGSTWLDPPRVFRAGPLTFAPAALAARHPGAIVLDDAPGDASFGTGLHPTTQLVIEHLVDRPPEGLRVLDVGTGTGILALAALALGAREVWAFDDDARAVAQAATNAERNRATTVHAITRWPELRGGADRVLANIDDATLEALASPLVGALASRATLVLSGVRASRADEVERTFTRLGLHAIRRVELGGWVCLELDASW